MRGSSRAPPSAVAVIGHTDCCGNLGDTVRRSITFHTDPQHAQSQLDSRPELQGLIIPHAATAATTKCRPVDTRPPIGAPRRFSVAAQTSRNGRSQSCTVTTGRMTVPVCEPPGSRSARIRSTEAYPARTRRRLDAIVESTKDDSVTSAAPAASH